jgi:hypothetical protein
MDIWYILWSFGLFFPVLVFCTKKNLATLLPNSNKNAHHQSLTTYSKLPFTSISPDDS